MTRPSAPRGTQASKGGPWALSAVLAIAGCGDGAAALRMPEPNPCFASPASLRRDQEYVFTVRWTSDGGHLLSGSVGEVRLLQADFAASTLVEVARYADQPGRIYADLSPDSTLAVSASTDVRLLAVETDPPRLTALATVAGHAGDAYAVAWSPVADRVLTGGEDGTVRLFSADRDAGSLTPLAIAADHGAKVFGVAWSPDGTLALSVGADRTLRLLAVGPASLTELSHATLAEWVNAVAWAPDKPILTGTWGQHNAVQAWSVDPETQALELTEEFAVHPSGIQVLEWSRDGSQLMTGGHDDTVTLFAHSSGGFAEIGSFENGDLGVHALSWSRDGAHAALAASHVDVVELLDVAGCGLDSAGGDAQ